MIFETPMTPHYVCWPYLVFTKGITQPPLYHSLVLKNQNVWILDFL